MTLMLPDGSSASAVLAELTDISYMAGWPALLVLIVVLLIVGLRNPYRRMFETPTPARPSRRRRGRRRSSTDRTP